MLILSVLMLAAGTTEMQAQWIKKLGKKAAESAKRATERNVEKKVEQTVDKAFDGAEDAVKGEGKNKDTKTADPTPGTNPDAGGQDVAQDGGQQSGQSLEMTYAKSDFVPGDEIIFEDFMETEQLGEFPSQWDLIDGEAEIATLNGKKCIFFVSTYNEGHVAPLMKDMEKYLPDEFTIELDFWMDKPGSRQSYWIYLYDDTRKNKVVDMEISNHQGEGSLTWNYVTPTNDKRDGSGNFNLKRNSWHHLSISFNKRAFKAYIDGIRIANIPAVKQSSNFSFRGRYWDTDEKAVVLKDVRIAKGAVPLYDRMLSDGKFITYGITFDVGKSTIKPESMGEINRIVQLMNENPDLRFSVEGHTDSTGNAASNQTLSEARSKAIVDKLVELGVSADRLSSAGKGQNSPIADNATDEGRAKNRRVEFVKI